MKPQTCLIITDGKAGDEQPCRALCEALGCSYETVRVKPSPFWALLMPWGPADPADWKRLDLERRAGAADMIVATGRRAVAYVRALRRADPRLFTVFLKDPRVGTGLAHVIWVPSHDRLRGGNVISTATGPHRFGANALEAIRKQPPADLARLPRPRIAVLVGGDSRHFTFTDEACGALIAGLEKLANTPASLMITVSRRTPDALVQRLRSRFGGGSDHSFWSGDGENPLAAYLALADAVVVTADSANMLGEAAATGVPLMVFEPPGESAKLRSLLQSLEEQGAVAAFDGTVPAFSYPPIDATPVIAAFVLNAYRRWRPEAAAGRNR